MPTDFNATCCDTRRTVSNVITRSSIVEQLRSIEDIIEEQRIAVARYEFESQQRQLVNQASNYADFESTLARVRKLEKELKEMRDMCAYLKDQVESSDEMLNTIMSLLDGKESA